MRAERAEPRNRGPAGRLPQSRDPGLSRRGALQPGPLPRGAWEPVASLWFPPWDERLRPLLGQPGRSFRLPSALSSPVRLQRGALLGRRGRRVSGGKTALGRRTAGMETEGERPGRCRVLVLEDDRDLLVSRVPPQPSQGGSVAP